MSDNHNHLDSSNLCSSCPTKCCEKRSILRWLMTSAVIFFAGCILILAVLPTLASTEWAKDEVITPMINKRIPGTISLQKLKLSWFGEQKIQGVEFQDAEGKTIVRFESLVTDTSLWNLLYLKPRLGKIDLNGLDVLLEQDETGLTNFHQAIFLSKSDQPLQGSIERIVVSNANARFNLPSSSNPLTVYFEGKTVHDGTQGSFKVDALVDGITTPSLWEWYQSFAIEENPNIQMKAKVENFPVEVLDRIVALKYPKARSLLRSFLGNELNLSLDQTTQDDGLAFQLKLNSPHIQGNLHGVANSQEFHLTRPGKLSIRLTPEFFETLAGKSVAAELALHATQATHIDFTLNSLTVPVISLSDEAAAKQAPPFAFRGEVALDQIHLASGSSLQQLHGTINTHETASHAQELQMTLGGEVVYNGLKGLFQMAGELATDEELLDEEDSLPFKLKLAVEGKDIPTPFLDRLSGRDSLLSDLVGPSLNIQTKLLSEGENTRATVQLSSQRLVIPHLTFELKDNEFFALKETATLQYRMSPSQLASQFPNSVGMIQSEIPFVLTLHQLSFPSPFIAERKPIFQPEKIILNAELTTADSFAMSPNANEQFRLSHFQMQIHGSSLANLQTVLAADIEQTDSQSRIAKALGDLIHFHLHSRLEIQESGLVDIQELTANINTNQGVLHLKGNVLGEESGEPFVTATGWLSYQLTPAILSQLDFVKQNAPVLANPSHLKVSVDALSFPVSANWLERLLANGRLEVDQFALNHEDGSPLAALEGIHAPWKIEGASKLAMLDLKGLTRLYPSGQEGSIRMQIAATDWVRDGHEDIKNLSLSTHAELQHLPVAIFEAFYGKSLLQAFVGHSFNATANAQLDFRDLESGTIDLAVEGSQFQAKAGLKVGKVISLKNPEHPVTISWTLTPEKFALIRHLLQKEPQSQEHHLALNSSSELSIQLSELGIPLLAPESTSDQWIFEKFFGLLQASGKGEIKIDKLSLSDSITNETTIFKPALFSFSSEGIARAFNVIVHTKGQIVSQAQPTEISLGAMVENSLTQDGKFNFDELSLTLDAKAKHAPIVLLCNAFCLGKQMLHQIDAIIGNELDASIQARLIKMNGPVNIFLKGTNGSLSFDGRIDDNILTLQQTLKAETIVTQKLSTSVLQDMMPLLSSAVGAEKPISIEIEPEGFSFPLQNWDVAKVAIQRAKIDLGKVYFNNEGHIGQLLGILNYREAVPGGYSTVWFTPLYLSMRQGSAFLERMDMLAVDLYPIAIWGVVDFNDDKVNMKIGLSSLALRNAFGVKGLPADYLLQLSLRGTTSAASIDKAKATTKIAALVAQSQGPQGILIGGILDLVGGNMKDKAAPPPTTQPFPWDVESHGETTDASSDMQEQEKGPLIPIKMLEKGASEILKIFR